jgi:aspartyl-tRNA synthetase
VSHQIGKLPLTLSDGEDNTGTISERMVRSVEHYPSETIVVVYALLRKAPKRVKNATIHDYELEVYEVHKVGNLTENVPFTVYDAENINRDKEDVEDEDSDEPLYPDGTPKDTPKDTPRTSRAVSPEPKGESSPISRISKDLTSRSKCCLGEADIF